MLRFLATSLLVVFVLNSELQAAHPQVKVSNVRKVFDNGEHNAFTDLIRFRGSFYLTFRSCPDGHMVHPTASIIVLRSRDLQRWEQVHRFSVPLRDTRDPHFLVFQEKLFIYGHRIKKNQNYLSIIVPSEVLHLMLKAED